MVGVIGGGLSFMGGECVVVVVMFERVSCWVVSVVVVVVVIDLWSL